MLRTLPYLLIVLISATSIDLKASPLVKLGNAASFINLESSPLLKLGESIDIYITGRAGTRYVSNVFLNSADKADDFIYTAQPGFEIVIGEQSIYGITIKMYEDMQFYQINHELNSFGENVEIDAFYDSGGITSITIDAAFNPTVSNSGSENVTGALIRRRNYKGGFMPSVDICKQ